MIKISNHELWFLQTIFTNKEKYITYKIIKENRNESVYDIIKFIKNTEKNLGQIFKNLEIFKKNLKKENKKIISFLEIEELRKKPLSSCHLLALEYKGNINILKQTIIAVIGSRRPTYYGRLQTKRIVSELSQMGFGILSGGAIGIDSVANSVAYTLGHSTVSVLGSGLAHLYPKSNAHLFEHMMASNHGLVLSEFESNTQPHKWNFPQRNMTIAALSDFVLVIEATKTSGSLMTAKFALDCHVDVGAVPGNIDNPNTQGTHALIEQGAVCVYNSDCVKESIKQIIHVAQKI